jgi:hypothetical protein
LPGRPFVLEAFPEERPDDDHVTVKRVGVEAGSAAPKLQLSKRLSGTIFFVAAT